jgi:hypothetical protein
VTAASAVARAADMIMLTEAWICSGSSGCGSTLSPSTGNKRQVSLEPSKSGPRRFVIAAVHCQRGYISGRDTHDVPQCKRPTLPVILRSTEVGLNGSLLAIRCRKCLKVLPEPGTNRAGDPIFGIGDIRSTDYYPAARKYDPGR